MADAAFCHNDGAVAHVFRHRPGTGLRLRQGSVQPHPVPLPLTPSRTVCVTAQVVDDLCGDTNPSGYGPGRAIDRRRAHRAHRAVALRPPHRRPAGRRNGPAVRSGERHVDAGAERVGTSTWSEEGILRGTGVQLAVTRHLLVRPEGDGWTVCFEDGRLFHPWRPGRPVLHPCAADTYCGLIAVDGSRPSCACSGTSPDRPRTAGSSRAAHGPDPARARWSGHKGVPAWNDRSRSSPTRASWPTSRTPSDRCSGGHPASTS